MLLSLHRSSTQPHSDLVKLSLVQPMVKTTRGFPGAFQCCSTAARETIFVATRSLNYTLSFVIEEQAVFPRPGMRSERYDIEQRKEHLSAVSLPLMQQAGAILFDRFERRYKEGLDLIVQGAGSQLQSRKAPAKRRQRA